MGGVVIEFLDFKVFRANSKFEYFLVFNFVQFVVSLQSYISPFTNQLLLLSSYSQKRMSSAPSQRDDHESFIVANIFKICLDCTDSY